MIPNYINKLKDKAADNLFSVGKVNVIVHSRGGLYTKSYIEGIDPRYPYKGNINSLITLNTPHFGSQAANLALDKRVVLDNESAINTFINKSIEDLLDVPVSDRGLTIGNVVSIFTVPTKDRVENWGARNLLVEKDDLSQVTADEDVRFIENLNSSENEAKLAEVPLHVISSTFDACGLNPVLCNDLERIDPTLAKSLPKQFKVFLYLYNLAVMVTNDIPNGLNNAAKYVYNGEESDMIVPASSMRGGLGGSRFSSEFTKIIHVNTSLIPGITEAPQVHERIKELLKSDVHKNQGFFTKEGIKPSALTYNFLPNYTSDSFTSNSARNNFTSKILINRDPAIFDNRVPSNTLDFKVYVEHVDKIIVSYENENTGDLFSFEIRNKEDIQFSNDSSFTIPENYFGKTTITAQGYKEGILGYASNTVTLNVGVHPDAVLQSIKFAQSNPIFLNQENYNYDLIGTFSDGIDRIINDLDGVTFSIEDPTIISQVDNRSVKGETAGSTILTATYNDLEAGVFVTIEDNPALFQTILSDFYGELSSDGSSVAVFWNTLREFENQTFILETSYGSPDNFTEIYTQLGNGTNTLPAEFSYLDTTFGDNELIFYRLKMVDVSGNETFSTIIEVNKIISSTTDFDKAATSLKLFPNPTNLDNVKLSLTANFSDKNARLDVFNLQGKRLYTQAVSVLNGNNEFDLTLPSTLSNNIYLVKISTLEFVKSIKLVVKK